jgi:hypothetical protein
VPEIYCGALVAHYQKNNRNNCQSFRHKKTPWLAVKIYLSVINNLLLI